MPKQPTKEELYFMGLKATIHSMVDLQLSKIKELEAAAEKYVKEQPHLKRVSKRHYNRDILIFSAGERILELALKRVEERRKEDPAYHISKKDFKEFVFRKIHNIGLFQVVVSAPEQIPQKVLTTYAPAIDKVFPQM